MHDDMVMMRLDASWDKVAEFYNTLLIIIKPVLTNFVKLHQKSPCRQVSSTKVLMDSFIVLTESTISLRIIFSTMGDFLSILSKSKSLGFTKIRK